MAEKESGAGHGSADTHDPEVPRRRMFRLMLAEYQLLRELSIGPVQLDNVTPSVLEAAEFLANLELVTEHERVVRLTDRGWRVVNSEPVSRTSYTIAFDRIHLMG